MFKRSKKCRIKKKDPLTDTAQNVFHLLEQFTKFKKTHCMNIFILENQIQDLTSSTWGHFRLYFHKILLDPVKKVRS